MIKFQPEHTVNIGLSCDINKLSSPISRSSNCSSLVASSSGCSSLPSSYQVYQQPVLSGWSSPPSSYQVYQSPTLVVAVLHLLVTRYTMQPILVVSFLPLSYQVYQQPALVVAVLYLLVTRYIYILVASCSSGCSSLPSSYQVYQQPTLVVAVLHLLVTRYIYQQPALVVAVLHLLVTRCTSSQLQWLQFSTFQLPGILVTISSGFQQILHNLYFLRLSSYPRRFANGSALVLIKPKNGKIQHLAFVWIGQFYISTNKE